MRATDGRVGRFFTISRSTFVAANSLRSFAFSASSSAAVRLPGGVASDGLRRAVATPLASVPLGILTLAAACSSERSCVKTRFTASSRSAIGYVFFNFLKAPVGATLPNTSVRISQAPHSLLARPCYAPTADACIDPTDRPLALLATGEMAGGVFLPVIQNDDKILGGWSNVFRWALATALSAASTVAQCIAFYQVKRRIAPF